MASSDFFLKFEGSHKFEGIEGAAEKAGHDLERLGASFADLGGDFLKLTHDAASEGRLPAVQHKIDDDLHKIDADFLKIGFDFIKLTDRFHKLDGAVAGLADQFIKFMPSNNEVPFPLAADFLKYEADLKITGLDFLAAGLDHKIAPAETSQLELLQDQPGLQRTRAMTSSRLPPIWPPSSRSAGFPKSPRLGTALLKLSDDSLKLANDYKIVSGDFLKVSQDLAPPTQRGRGDLDRSKDRYQVRSGDRPARGRLHQAERRSDQAEHGSAQRR